MRTDRLLGITLLLIERKRISAAELARTFEVSTRTIYRDIESLAMAGIPVYATPGIGGGIHILPDYKLDKGLFTLDDLSSLLTALSSLEGIVDPGTRANTAAKLRALIPDQQREQVAQQMDRIRIDPTPWMGNGEADAHLILVRKALAECVVLQFSYLSSKGNLSRRHVEPLQLVLKNGKPYLYGWCRTRQDFRLFKVVRMLEVRTTAETFSPRPLPAADLDVTSYGHELQETITLRVTRRVAEQVLDYCSFSNFTPDGPDHYRVAFPFINRDYYYGTLLSFGPGCEVLDPPEVRNRMAEIISQLSNLYASASSVQRLSRGSITPMNETASSADIPVASTK